jgi:universal stress protein E
MNEPSPIIAGIDFSASSASVLHHSLHSSASSSAPVIALHVLDASRLAHDPGRETGVSNTETINEDARSKFQAWLEDQTSANLPKIDIRCGQPAKEIHQSIKDNRASLLVIAANDTTKKRLGTIASRCVRTAPCDVMILRNWQSGNFKKIIVCTDFSKTASLALTRAVSIATEQGAELDIVHVMYPPSRDVWGEVIEVKLSSPQSYAEVCRSRVNDSMDRFLAPHRDTLAKINHRCTILESVAPALEITTRISDTEADLVIMGTHGHSPFMSHFLGTNAERLMHDSPVSVLAVRGPGETAK